MYVFQNGFHHEKDHILFSKLGISALGHQIILLERITKHYTQIKLLCLNLFILIYHILDPWVRRYLKVTRMNFNLPERIIVQ